MKFDTGTVVIKLPQARSCRTHRTLLPQGGLFSVKSALKQAIGQVYLSANLHGITYQKTATSLFTASEPSILKFIPGHDSKYFLWFAHFQVAKRYSVH